jgi:hypothetical protein
MATAKSSRQQRQRQGHRAAATGTFIEPAIVEILPIIGIINESEEAITGTTADAFGQQLGIVLIVGDAIDQAIEKRQRRILVLALLGGSAEHGLVKTCFFWPKRRHQSNPGKSHKVFRL